jgi:hypothetical protein
VTYLDTGCFVKLYYPEPDSAQVVALIQGKALCHTPLHELELMNALQLKVFLGSATAGQVTAARALVETDLKAGVLVSPSGDWQNNTPERLAAVHWIFCIAPQRRFWVPVSLFPRMRGSGDLPRRWG